jgi:hypothetical protein
MRTERNWIDDGCQSGAAALHNDAPHQHNEIHAVAKLDDLQDQVLRALPIAK